MKKSMLRNILIILAIVIFSGVMVIAITTHGRTAPRPALAEQAADVSPESSLSETIHLEQKSKNNNLENKITQGQKKKEEKIQKGQEENKAQQGDAKEDTDKDKNDKDHNDPDKDNNDENNGGKPNKPESPDEYTDLPENAYVEESLSVEDLMKEIGIDDPNQIIYAKAITGAGKESWLKLINGVYSVYLSTQGTTIIQIKYKDDSGEVHTYNKKITYKRPEGSTPKKKRPIINTTLKNEASYSNKTVNFDVWVTNYRGKPLSYSNMEVTVNGKHADYIGEMGRQTYSVQLKVGANTVRIKVKDSYQYTVTKVYTIYYKSGKARITISLEAGTIGLKYLISPMKMEVESGKPLSAVIDEFLTANGYTYQFTGSIDKDFYLAKIQKKNMIKGYKIPGSLIKKLDEDGLTYNIHNYESLNCLGEFDFCQGAGWMYSINNIYPTIGFGRSYVENGDVVRIRFTLAYGKDIGGASASQTTDGLLQNYGREW